MVKNRKERPTDCCICGHQKWLHTEDGTCIADNFICRCQGYKVDFWWLEENEKIEVKINNSKEVLELKEENR